MTNRQLLEIPFTSGRSGVGPATWGQRAFWDTIRALAPADRPRYNVAGGAPIDPGLPLPVLVDALAQLLRLHDSLRTRLFPGKDGQLLQTVDAEGTLTLEVHSCPDTDGLPEAGARLHRELSARTFDTAMEWPLHVAVIEADGLVRYATLALPHTAVDGAGMNRLVADLAALCLGSTPAELAELRVPARQPLEEAEFQRSPRGARRDSAGRREFLRKLRSGPARQFPRPAGPPDPGPADPKTAHPEAADPAARFPNAVLRSPALAIAVEQVAAGHRASTSSVLLAAVAAMTARMSGSNDALIDVVVSNRFLPELANSVSAVAGEVLLHLPDADGEFGALVRRTHAAALGGYLNSYYDRTALDAQIAELTAEGVPLADRSCVFNDVREVVPPGTDAPGEPGATTLTWPVDFEPRPGLTYALDAVQSGEALSLAMTADPAVLPRPEMERFLYGVEETVLSEARALGQVPTA
ncbi:condensation domain-containing protein [Streptomyces sp. NRRL WC-3742]|uniref:condensation domain-containing protein n=1 Tax=Streptomyces sp. NRRL WC-3742 TaxID=1463934 RepID=UPI00068C40B1|nr:condensation domain-containing protein [Streptomyces sp. NRRL WC-3742]